jgi:hypothetical protein
MAGEVLTIIDFSLIKQSTDLDDNFSHYAYQIDNGDWTKVSDKSFSSSVSGQLSSSDFQSGGKYYDEYYTTIKAGQTINITQNNSDFRDQVTLYKKGDEPTSFLASAQSSANNGWGGTYDSGQATTSYTNNTASDMEVVIRTSSEAANSTGNYNLSASGYTLVQKDSSITELTQAINNAANTMDLAAGSSHTINVKGVDKLGAESVVASDTFTISANAPIISGLDAVSALNPAYDSAFSNASSNAATAGHLSISLNISDADNNISEYAYKFDNNSWTTFTNKASFDSAINAERGSNLASGLHTLYVKTTDPLGSVTSSSGFTINAAPSISSIDAVNSGNNLIGSGSKLDLAFVAADSDGTLASFSYNILD